MSCSSSARSIARSAGRERVPIRISIQGPFIHVHATRAGVVGSDHGHVAGDHVGEWGGRKIQDLSKLCCGIGPVLK